MGNSSIEELAVFGGKPVFEKPLYVGRPNIGDRDLFFKYLNDILERRWLTNNGQYVQEFQRKLASMIGVKHCIVMCNATIALEIVIRALGMTGEVIVPSFTFIATAHSLQWQQITPVFCDIEPETNCLDPIAVEKMITPRTTGIIGVHVWGRPCNVEALTEIARRRGLKLLFDAAHALGCSYKGEMIGRFGDAEVFSFHATKFFNTFEGGAITTDNDELAEKIRLMKNFGFSRTSYDDVIYIGTNGKMSEVSAAMGLASLERINEFIDVNYNNYLTYKKELTGIHGIRLINHNENERNNYQYIIIEIDELVTRISRDNIVKILHAENVRARRYFYPGCHQMEPYKSYFPHARLLLPRTEELARRVISLPNGTAVSSGDISEICRIIRLAAANGPEIQKKLNAAD